MTAKQDFRRLKKEINLLFKQSFPKRQVIGIICCVLFAVAGSEVLVHFYGRGSWIPLVWALSFWISFIVYEYKSLFAKNNKELVELNKLIKIPKSKYGR